MHSGAGGYQSSRALGYIPALDGLRGVAIALVVSWHAFGWPARGFLGVHLFFVLSGFLITTLLLEEWQRRGDVSLLSFYRRRALRLLPALAALLATYTGLQLVRSLASSGGHDLSTALEGVLYSAFYVANIVQAAGVVLPVPLNHLWSLAAEEQFYVLWPFALLLALRLGVRLRYIEFGLVGAVVLVAVERARLAFENVPYERIYYAPDTTFDPILIGCLLGVWFALDRGPRALRREALLRMLLAPALVLLALPVVWTGPVWGLVDSSWVLLFGLATALLLWSVAAGRARLLERALSVSPLVGLGKISYSLYLWHPLVIWSGLRLLGLPATVGVVLAIPVATASYLFIERPFLRRKRRERAKIDGEQRTATPWHRKRPVALRAGAVD